MTASRAGDVRAQPRPRQYGNTLIAARAIADQVRAAFELLATRASSRWPGGRTLWDVVRATWGDDAPDIDRFVTMGQSGQQLLGWAGTRGGGHRRADVGRRLDAAALG